MTRMPQMRSEIFEAERHLRGVLLKKKAAPASMAHQLAKMASHYALKGRVPVHPGMKEMAAWAMCSTRQARTNYRAFVNALVVVEVGNQTGGRGIATEWIIDPNALRMWLVVVGANPSQKLVDRLRRVLARPEKAEVKPLLKAEVKEPIKAEVDKAEKAEADTPLKAEVKAEVTSARIRYLRGRS